MADVAAKDLDFWLFGYGYLLLLDVDLVVWPDQYNVRLLTVPLNRSLIWKPPPHYDQRVPGYVTGYVRRFWQASQDHRGTPSSPGRVVTLIERSFWETLGDDQEMQEKDRVWGVAYHIVPSKVQEVQAYLDIREINGYSIQYTPFKPADPTLQPFRCLVYIGLPDNPQFLGALDPQIVAEVILRSRGPSGDNVEYLVQLETALDQLSTESGDGHVTDLANRVRQLQSHS